MKHGLWGWSIGFDTQWNRDIGYGVPAKCDHPDCDDDIDRGLGCVCGGEPYGGESGCGLYFCGKHLLVGGGEHQQCERCDKGLPPFQPKPDTAEWIEHKATDPSWSEWRASSVASLEGVT